MVPPEIFSIVLLHNLQADYPSVGNAAESSHAKVTAESLLGCDAVAPVQALASECRQ